MKSFKILEIFHLIAINFGSLYKNIKSWCLEEWEECEKVFYTGECTIICIICGFEDGLPSKNTMKAVEAVEDNVNNLYYEV